MHILVTGGTGYIGSHACLELLKAGYQVSVVDNLSNSKEASLLRVQEITGKSLSFHKVDLIDRSALEAVFKTAEFDAVMHFAGLKAPGELVSVPLRYYHNNITGTVVLCEVMAQLSGQESHLQLLLHCLWRSCQRTRSGKISLVFNRPIRTGAPSVSASKSSRIWLVSDPAWNIALLRYFNPVGAHPSGRIGEDPRGIPEQPAAIHLSGSGWSLSLCTRLGQRLSDARWHRDSRLHPRRRPGPGSPESPGEAARKSRPGDL